MSDWLSVHLGVGAPLYGAEADALIRSAVEPFVREAWRSGHLRRFFFIRYGEGGPHLRLRMLARSDTARRALRAAARTSTFRRLGVTHGVRWVPYEPEFDRYGGSTAISVAERLFHASSRFALNELVGRVSADRTRRMGLATVAMLLQFRAFTESRVQARREAIRYRDGYLAMLTKNQLDNGTLGTKVDETVAHQSGALRQQFAGVWELLGDPSTLPASLRRFNGALARARVRLSTLAETGLVQVAGRSCPTWAEASAALLPSFMHMTNNRLGVSVPEEVLLAGVVAEVLDDT